MSQPKSSREHHFLEAMSSHPTSLGALEGELKNSRKHEEVCATRQIQLSDQKLRVFVVRHSVLRIHCALVFAIVLVALTLVGPIPAELLVAALTLASIIVAASSRSINGAIGSDLTSSR